jgi:hypothetical protein
MMDIGKLEKQEFMSVDFPPSRLMLSNPWFASLADLAHDKLKVFDS